MTQNKNHIFISFEKFIIIYQGWGVARGDPEAMVEGSKDSGGECGTETLYA